MYYYSHLLSQQDPVFTGTFRIFGSHAKVSCIKKKNVQLPLTSCNTSITASSENKLGSWPSFTPLHTWLGTPENGGVCQTFSKKKRKKKKVKKIGLIEHHPTNSKAAFSSQQLRI